MLNKQNLHQKQRPHQLDTNTFTRLTKVHIPQNYFFKPPLFSKTIPQESAPAQNKRGKFLSCRNDNAAKRCTVSMGKNSSVKKSCKDQQEIFHHFTKGDTHSHSRCAPMTARKNAPGKARLSRCPRGNCLGLLVGGVGIQSSAPSAPSSMTDLLNHSLLACNIQEPTTCVSVRESHTYKRGRGCRMVCAKRRRAAFMVMCKGVNALFVRVRGCSCSTTMVTRHERVTCNCCCWWCGVTVKRGGCRSVNCLFTIA